MGRGIAQAAALAGYRTILEDILPASLRRAEDEIRGLESDDETVAAAVEVGRRMGKQVVVERESPGFITSRINALIGSAQDAAVAGPADRHEEKR
jgi:3-hydroxyacyl-CoA dehydrogenase